MSTGGLPGFSNPRPNTPSNLAQATANSTPTPAPGNVSTTEPGRIPVTSLTQSGLAALFKQADTAAKSGSGTTTKSGSATGSGPLFYDSGYDRVASKPQGASAKDWTKYNNMWNLDQTKWSQSDIKFMNNFNTKYGTKIPPPTQTPGPGTGTPPLDSGGFVQGLGLLSRPYDNPFERRDLWRLFPNAGGQM